MLQDILPALREEERQLLVELQQTPLFQKLEAIRQVISVYAGRDQISTETPAKPKPATRGKGAAILDAAEAYLESIGRRAQTGEIAAELVRRGLPPGKKENQNGAASAYLSGAKDRFDNRPGEGYGLVRWSSRPSASSNGREPTDHTEWNAAR